MVYHRLISSNGSPKAAPPKPIPVLTKPVQIKITAIAINWNKVKSLFRKLFITSIDITCFITDFTRYKTHPPTFEQFL